MKRSVGPARRERELDEWLATYGHRGPLESDLARPRFAELREVLLADLSRSEVVATPANDERNKGRGLLFALDRRRESFRDELMRIWQELRQRVREAAEREGFERFEDVFLITREDLDSSAEPDLAARREELARLSHVDLPTTAKHSAIEGRLASTIEDPSADETDAFHGVSLSTSDFEGRVQRADDLVTLLEDERRAERNLVDGRTVLVVPALEPSWAVIFGRVGAVVTELGGELSHASILLREARKPAVVNCTGIWSALADGDRVRLHGRRGVVERIRSEESAPGH